MKTAPSTSAGRRCPQTTLAVSLIVAVAAATHAGDDAAPAPAALSVRVEQADGATLAGRLEALTDREVRLIVDGAARALPVSGVRRILRDDPPAARAARVTVTFTDGARLCADDFVREGDRALLTVGTDDRIEVPFDLVKTVAWAPKPDTAAAPPPWLAAIPEKPESDLVVVSGREEGFEIVSCAIADVGPEAVTVELDGETIPVKRAKVVGLVWLRPPRPPAGGTRVTVGGGSMPAGTVAWSPRHLLVDDVRLPAGSLVEIDYAAGRTVRLASLPMERASSEPFFGSLARVDGMAAFFAPRTLPAADPDRGVLVIRPRTMATWRVPADSRRFRAGLCRAARATGAVEVSIMVDDRELFRRRLDGAAADDVAVDVDVTSGRRLTIAVDFVAGDLGCPVRFTDPAFEK